jgi:hypothetical protein
MGAFDPDAYLAKPASGGFDPDAYLAQTPARVNNHEDVFGKSTAQAEAPVSWRDRIMGVVETPATVLGGIASGIAGNVAGVIGELSSPAKQGTPEARAAGEALAAKARAQFYQPRTQTAPQILNALAPVTEAVGAIPSVNAMQLGQSVGPAMRAVGDVRAAQMGQYAARNARLAAPAEAALQAERIAESTRNAPRIEAAQAAPKYNIALPPDESNPVKGNLIKGVVAGEKVKAQLSKQNVSAVNSAVAQDMGLPENTPLTKAAFTEARNLASGPYRAVEQLPVLEAPPELIAKIDKLKGDPALIGGNKPNADVAALVDHAIEKMSEGMSGAEILKNIRQQRSTAQRVYKSNNASVSDMQKADAHMGIANALEDLIDSNIQDPKLLSDFRQARVNMAKTYAYQSATDLNSGNVDPRILAKITAESDHVTGTLADLGKIAGNFPSVMQGANVSYSALPTLTRSGLGGSIGYAAGSAVGMPLQGSIAGAATGGLLSRYMAKKIGTPEYQAAHAIPVDYRPVNNLRPANINYGPNQLAPYDFSQATDQPYRPNWVPGRGTPPTAQFVGPEAGPPQLGAPSAESTMASVAAERARRYNIEKAMAEAPIEQVTPMGQMAGELERRNVNRGRGSVIEIDPVTGKMTLGAEATGGMTPNTQVISSTGANLQSAAEKVTAGRNFDLTAAEKVAWEKTRADIAKVSPELAKLSDKDILDRKVLLETVNKARQKAQMFDEISQRRENSMLSRDAAIKRDEMLDLAELLEENMRAPRPVSSGGQGPKTREFRRNQLAQDREIKNKLLKD